MNENLKNVLKMMLFFSDEQILDIDEFNKINFKKKNWFKSYHWTEKQEEKFIVWLSNYLKKDWQGITDYKPSNKKLRDIAARQFVSNYGCVVRELNSDDFSNDICNEQLKQIMSERELKEFNKWMFGQTCPLYGVYRWDLERWLRHKPVID